MTTEIYNLVEEIGWTNAEFAYRAHVGERHARRIRLGQREAAPVLLGWLKALALAHRTCVLPNNWQDDHES